MMTKTVYQTDPLGLFLGPVTADESPLEPGVLLIPGGCVELEPPHAPEHKVACWNNGGWQLLDYFNGLIVYSTVSGEPLTVTGPGPIPNGYTVQKPELGQVWEDGRWVDDLDTMLGKLFALKLEAINTGCATHIEAGFSSDALGELYRYDSTFADQMNLTGLILSGLDALCACYGSDNEKVFREHTADQLHTVGRELVTHKQAALRQSESLKRNLATTLADRDLRAMQAIEWHMPA